jgi:hypothetical protein
MTIARRPLTERFAEKFTVGAPDECWEWEGPRRGRGYGAINEGGSKGRTLVATHVAWELATGSPVPTGLIVLHSCDNPPCVNPAHLRVGTHADNSADRVTRGRHVRGAAHPRSRLSESDAISVLELLAGGVHQRTIAARFHISQSLVSGIRCGTHWSHLERPNHEGI